MADVVNLEKGKKALRKTLITVAEWGNSEKPDREILGARTEDSSIEFNPETETSTDILGITYTDVQKTEPQHDFDSYYLLGGSKLGAYLATAALENDIQAYNNSFNIYVSTAFIGVDNSTNPPVAIYRVTIQIDYIDMSKVIWK